MQAQNWLVLVFINDLLLPDPTCPGPTATGE